ncbi:MAG: VWA domain-containing protein [Myxococcota bacterium]
MGEPTREELQRWRLVLGDAAGDTLGAPTPTTMAMDHALSWLYDREAGLSERGIRRGGGREGGGGASSLTVPDWLSEVHRLFPKETIERLERDAVERYGIDEVVTNPDVLSRVEPNMSLLRAVLKTKHLMNPEVLAMARKLVQKVVRELLEALRAEVRPALVGTLNRRRSSRRKMARNFDLRRTLHANLRHYKPSEKRIYLEQPYFFTRSRRNAEEWQVILLVDQSGSMLGSVIHSAVTAACLWGIPGLRPHLCIFDTEVVDLTNEITDPVDTLMRVTLGGGTDIGKAVRYGASLVTDPRRAIVVLITDFFEGGSLHPLVGSVRALVEQGTKVIGLAALDPEANPDYDRVIAQELVEVGAHVGAMTPGELAGWIAEVMGG